MDHENEGQVTSTETQSTQVATETSSQPVSTPVPSSMKSHMAKTGESGRITSENWAERAKKLKEGRENPQKDAEKELKTPENKVETAVTQEPAKPKKEVKKEGKSGEKAPEPKTKNPSLAVVPEKVENEQDPEPGYKPNPKYTALGKEYELPSWAAGAIKDEASEREIKEVFEKAMGLEHVKARHQELYTRHQQVDGAYKELVGGVEGLKDIYASAVQSGNLLLLDDFFDTLKIPFDVLLHYAAQKVELNQAPLEQKQAIMGNLNTLRQNRALQQQNLEHATTATTAQSKALGSMLDACLARPDIATIAQAFDTAPGRKPGDFRNRVIDHGEFTWLKTGGKTMLPPDEAIKQVVEMFGLTQAPAQSAPQGAPQAQPQAQTTVNSQAPAPQAQPQTPAVAPHRNVPVIPSVSGKNTASPVKQRPRSIADLRKLKQGQTL